MGLGGVVGEKAMVYRHTMKNLFQSLKGDSRTNHSPLTNIRHACRHQLGSLSLVHHNTAKV